MSLRITVEIVPWGDESKKSLLSETTVSYAGDFNRDKCNYSVETKDNETSRTVFETVRAHTRKHGYWKLVARAFEALHSSCGFEGD